MFEDASGESPCVMFADVYAEFAEKLNNDVICFLRGEVDTSREETGLIATNSLVSKRLLSVCRIPLVRIDGPVWGRVVIPSIKAVLFDEAGRSLLSISTSGRGGTPGSRRLRASE